MNDILVPLEAAGYAAIFLAVGLPLLGLAWFVLDVITPGHKIGDRLAGRPVSGGLTGVEPSHSAGLVASAWMIMQSLIIFTAIWTNAHGTDLSAALMWTVVFSLVGLIFQSVAFWLLDMLTPGNLSDEICSPGPVIPLARVAAANIVAIGVLVIAVIS